MYLDKDKDKAHVSLYIVLFLRREDGQTTKMEFIGVIQATNDEIEIREELI